MKALSLTQPWASLVAIGAKTIETRSWSVSFRGWLAIHATKGFPSWARDLVYEPPFAGALATAGIHSLGVQDAEVLLPRGAIIAVAVLQSVDCISRRADGAVITLRDARPIVGDELAFGDYTAGRYAWRLAHVHRLPAPLPCRGAQGLWTVPAEIEETMRRQVRPLADDTGETRALPTAAELTGSDPDFTGGLTTEQFMREIRGD